MSGIFAAGFDQDVPLVLYSVKSRAERRYFKVAAAATTLSSPSFDMSGPSSVLTLSN